MPFLRLTKVDVVAVEFEPDLPHCVIQHRTAVIFSFNCSIQLVTHISMALTWSLRCCGCLVLHKDARSRRLFPNIYNNVIRLLYEPMYKHAAHRLGKVCRLSFFGGTPAHSVASSAGACSAQHTLYNSKSDFYCPFPSLDTIAWVPIVQGHPRCQWDSDAQTEQQHAVFQFWGVFDGCCCGIRPIFRHMC